MHLTIGSFEVEENMMLCRTERKSTGVNSETYKYIICVFIEIKLVQLLISILKNYNFYVPSSHSSSFLMS
jgi:hypothetical protein